MRATKVLASRSTFLNIYRFGHLPITHQLPGYLEISISVLLSLLKKFTISDKKYNGKINIWRETNKSENETSSLKS